MATSAFSKMKRNRTSIDALKKRIDAEQKGGSGNKDERFYYPELDENKNGSAIIRFLPPAEGEDSPWITEFSHGFKENGKWFIEDCLTTIGKDCPVCEANSKLWNSGIESDKEIVRRRKRKKRFVANILVVEDRKHPENEGKVFLFRFGVKIFDKIKSAMYPEFDDEVAINPFDMWEGANFRLKIREFEGNINYDKSTFDAPTAISDDDTELERIWRSEYKLQEVLYPENAGGEVRFKSYDQIKERFQKALGNAPVVSRSADEMSKDAPTMAPPKFASKQESAPAADDVPWHDDAPKAAPAATPSASDDEDPMAMFRKLAEGGV